MNSRKIPEGFERQSAPSPLTAPWEPIYAKTTDNAIVLGLWLDIPHTNRRGFAHGGLIAALTDKAMGHSCGHKLRGAHSLIEIATDVIKTGRTLCFAQCVVTADGEIIARANATFRVVKKAA